MWSGSVRDICEVDVNGMYGVMRWKQHKSQTKSKACRRWLGRVQVGEGPSNARVGFYILQQHLAQDTCTTPAYQQIRQGLPHSPEEEYQVFCWNIINAPFCLRGLRSGTETGTRERAKNLGGFYNTWIDKVCSGDIFKKSDIFRCVYVLFDAYSVADWIRPHVCSLDIKKGIFSVTFCPR